MMMTTFESARAEWVSMLDDAVPQQRLFDSHPLHLYFGVSNLSSPLLLLVTDSEANLPELSGPIKTVKARRADGRHATSIGLDDKRYARAFVGMCIELARATQEVGAEGAALKVLARTLQHWKKMFSNLGERRLSDSEIQGLVAEIHFVVTSLIPLRGVRDGIDAWVGPFGAPQDFCFHDRLIEVKSLRPGVGKIWITSVGQLDVQSVRPLVLATVEVVDVAFGSGASSMSLRDHASELHRLAGDDPDVIEALEARWAALGLDLRDEVYASKFFRVGEVSLFAVRDDFPIVRAEFVPSEVGELKYRLRTGPLERFKIEAPFDAWESGARSDR
jgi:hypothetical protein